MLPAAPADPRSVVLQVGALTPGAEAALLAEFRVVRLPKDFRPFLEKHGGGITVVVTSATVGVQRPVMELLPDLRAIVNFGVGYETTDVAAATELGVAVSNTPDVLTDCVADLAVGLLIDVLRRMSAADRFVRAGGWPAGPYPIGTQVTGKRVGIVGLGRIGSAIARRLGGFDTEIAYHSRTPVSGSAYPYVGSVAELAARSDVLILALAAGLGTQAMVSREVLEALGPAGYLINIARGSLVDEDALLAALEAGTIAGAALDVFAAEPHVPERLRRMDNVVLLPHMGSATTETRGAMADLFLANLRQFLQDGSLRTPVSTP
ncbi:MAG: lactate dehydrogenase-like oxidoreductase [Naasia sp.]|nr:lactate dehydrogenase-like oxidoreductase [Naasia sp.]